MIFRLTNKLAKKLKELPLAHCAQYSPANPYLEWYANYFTLNRYQHILVTNASSLLTIVMHGGGITDIDRFIDQFMMQLQDCLLEIDCELILRRVIHPNTGSFIVAKTIDRTVLGNMNEMKKKIELYNLRYELSPVDMTELINRTPYNTIGFMTPKEKFKNMELGDTLV